MNKNNLKKEIKEKRSPIICTVLEYAALSVFVGGFAYFLAANAGVAMSILAAGLGFGVPLIVSLPLIMLYYRKEIKEIRNLKKQYKYENAHGYEFVNIEVKNKEYSSTLDFKNKTIKRFGVTSLQAKENIKETAPEQNIDDFNL